MLARSGKLNPAQFRESHAKGGLRIEGEEAFRDRKTSWREEERSRH
jgi:hypothetical protein